ncbi:hypothetical protein ACFQU2_27440 [Siccirubricoccus deserti]
MIDNRTGATGMIGSGFVASAPPDGYTVLYGTTPSRPRCCSPSSPSIRGAISSPCSRRSRCPSCCWCIPRSPKTRLPR